MNRAHTERLRQELYAERERTGRGAQGAVAVPEAFIQDDLGRLLEQFLSNLDKWFRVIPLPMKFEQGPVFEPFARIGLLFTENLDRIRQAYTRAGEMLELWGDGPAAAPPVRLLNSG